MGCSLHGGGTRLVGADACGRAQLARPPRDRHGIPGRNLLCLRRSRGQILSRGLNLPTIRLATEGPAQNIEMLEAGEAKLGFVTMGIALQAWNGTGAWTGKKP